MRWDYGVDLKFELITTERAREGGNGAHTLALSFPTHLDLTVLQTRYRMKTRGTYSR